MDIETKTYKTDCLTFFVSPTSIIVCTPLGQAFYLVPRTPYYRRRIKVVRAMIELDEIRNLNELAEWCAGGLAIEWQSTSRKIDVDNLQPVM